MHNDPTHAKSPSRRSVAKGAAWALPVLTAAGVAPSLAASNLCSAASEEDINVAIALDKKKPSKLTLEFSQTTAIPDGGVVRVKARLKNRGTTAILASTGSPVVVQVTFVTAQAGRDRHHSGIWPDFATNSQYGQLDQGNWVTGTRKYTWTLTANIPASDDREMQVTFEDTTTPERLVHATAVLTEFGANDNLTPADFRALNRIVEGEQITNCRTSYNTKVQANLTAEYTLRARGALKDGEGIAWPVGQPVSSKVIGNYAPTVSGPPSKNGIW